jgi:cell division protease FtsH
VFRHVSTGAADDLSKATDIARSMVTRYGMGAVLGPVAYETEPQGYLGALSGPTRLYAEETAREIDLAVRELVSSALERARAILVANRSLLDESAKELLSRETLSDGPLASLLGRVHPEARGDLAAVAGA